MKRKTKIVQILLVSCAWFFLGKLQASSCGFDSLYVGGSIGGNLLQGRQTGISTGSLTTGGTSNLFIFEPNTDYFKEVFTGEVFAGFGHQFGCLYTGLEVFGQYSRLHASHARESIHAFPLEDAFEGSTVNNRVAIGPWHYGIDLRPGFLLTPTTLLYGRVGVTGTQLKFRTNASTVFSIGDESPTTAFEDTSKKHRHYLRYGLGIDKMINPNLALRFEYVFTNYRSLNVGGSSSGPAFGSVIGIAESSKVKLKTHELQLGLSYYFSNCCLPQPWKRCSNYCGWYLGAGIAGGFENDRYSVNALNISPGPDSAEEGVHPHNFIMNKNKTAVGGALWAGYGLQFNALSLPLFAGLEVFGQYLPYLNRSRQEVLFIDGFNAALFTANTTLTSKTEINPWQYGIQVRPGILLSPSTLLFGTVGVSAAKLLSQHHLQFDNPAAGVSFDLDTKKQHTRPVLRIGGGLEYDLCFSGWHLRADYHYTNYRTFSLSGSRSISTGTPLGTISLANNSSIHMKDHVVLIGINKYFSCGRTRRPF